MVYCFCSVGVVSVINGVADGVCTHTFFIFKSYVTSFVCEIINQGDITAIDYLGDSEGHDPQRID